MLDFAQGPTRLHGLFIAPHYFSVSYSISDPLFIDEERVVVSPQRYFRILGKVGTQRRQTSSMESPCCSRHGITSTKLSL